MSRLKSFLTTSACALALATSANAGSFDIPAGDLKTALDIYARQSGAELAISGEAVRGARTKGVKGNLPADEALTRILSGTGFKARDIDGSLIIVPNKQSNIEIQSLQLAQANPAAGRIEEVLVTARKREESVENIPISITALSSEDLKTYGVRNFADLEGVVPGLNLGGGGNGVKKDSNPFIRGVGQRETKVTLDPAVATYIDGIYIGRAAGAMMDVTDVANIQVLRGPQGTLFGRNATGGALSVTFNKPTNNWEAQVTANIGNYGQRDLSGMINVPIIEDMLMGRLFIASINSNGFFTNIVDNTKWGGDNRVTGIAQLRFLPTDDITIDILGERTRVRETPRPQRCAYLRNTNFTTTLLTSINGSRALYGVDGLNRFEGLCKRSAALPMSQFASDAAIGNEIMPKARYFGDTSTAAVTANWDIGNLGPFSDLNAKSISAWRKTKQIADEDLDAVNAAFLIRIQPDFDETVQWSQEVQLSGKTFNDRLFLSAGAFYFKERAPGSDLLLSAGISPTDPRTNTTCPTGCFFNVMAEATRERLETDNHSYALYGQADFDITPQIQLTGGIRWTTETHWSRYSKARVDFSSVVPGLISAGQVLGSPLFNVYHATSTINPVSSWQYGSPVYYVANNASASVLTAIGSTLARGVFVGDDLSYTSSAWTPMASLKYKFSDRMLEKLRLDQAMVYATYSQGFHAGGVTNGAVDTDRGAYRDTSNNWQLPEPGYGTADPVAFRPEKVTNYEVGFKLAALDRRIQTSFAAFRMDYTDMQVTGAATTLGIPAPYIENVGKSVIQGFEAEIVAMPTPQWRIMATGSYTDADIKTWMSEVRTLSTDGTQTTTNPIYYIDRSDERMPRVPRWQFFTSTEYNFNFGSAGMITPSVGVRFASSIYHGFDRGSWVYSYGGYYYNHNGELPPTTFTGTLSVWRRGSSASQQDNPPVLSPDAKWKTTSRPTAFLDARLNWVSADGKINAALWGKNLFNKDDYLVGGIPLADVTGAVGQVIANPRTFGLTFTYHFGE